MLLLMAGLLCGPVAMRGFAAETPAHGKAAVAETAHGEAGAKAEGGEEESGVPELPNILEVLHLIFKDKPQAQTFNTLYKFQNVIFFYLIGFMLIVVAFFGTRRLKKIPSGFQAFLEFAVTALDGFICGIIGPKGRAYVPLCGTIFIFILCMNLAGIVPLAKSPIAININVPATLALCVFFFVQYHGIRQNGLVGYIKHYIEPLPIYMLPITLLLVVIHIIGELAKPLTLTLRLFGNISAEDIVIAALAIMGTGLMMLPLHVLFFPLGLLFSFIQALIFTVLSSVYILLLMGHNEAHGEESH